MEINLEKLCIELIEEKKRKKKRKSSKNKRSSKYYGWGWIGHSDVSGGGMDGGVDAGS